MKKFTKKIVLSIFIMIVSIGLLFLALSLKPVTIQEPIKQTGCSTNFDCGYSFDDICYNGQCMSGSEKCKQVLYLDFSDRASLSKEEPCCLYLNKHCTCELTLEYAVYQELEHSRILIQAGKYDEVFFELT